MIENVGDVFFQTRCSCLPQICCLLLMKRRTVYHDVRVFTNNGTCDDSVFAFVCGVITSSNDAWVLSLVL